MTCELVNTHEQLTAAGGGIAIIKAYAWGRDGNINGWHIYRVNEHGRKVATDLGAPWYHHECKWFVSRANGTFHERQRQALEAARVWIAETYGELGPWVRNRLGDYLPERIHETFPLRPLRRKP